LPVRARRARRREGDARGAEKRARRKRQTETPTMCADKQVVRTVTILNMAWQDGKTHGLSALEG